MKKTTISDEDYELLEINQALVAAQEEDVMEDIKVCSFCQRPD